jgi:hypothetical protein
MLMALILAISSGTHMAQANTANMLMPMALYAAAWADMVVGWGWLK